MNTGAARLNIRDRRKIQLRTAFSVFVAIIILVLILGSLLFGYIQRQLHAHIENQIVSQLSSFRIQIDHQLINVEDSVYRNIDYGSIIDYQNARQQSLNASSASNDASAEESLTPVEQQDNTVHALPVMDMLRNIKQGNAQIQEVLLYIKDAGEVVSTNSVIDSADFFQRVYFFQFSELNSLMNTSINTDEQQNILLTNEFVYYSPYYDQLFETTSLIFSLPINTWNNNISLIVLLDDSCIALDAPAAVDASSTLLMNGSGDVLKRSNRDLNFYDIKHSALHDQISKSSALNGIVTSKIGGSVYNAFFIKSLSSDLILTSVLPKQHVTGMMLAGLSDIIKWIWLPLVLILLVAGVITLYVYRYILARKVGNLSKAEHKKSDLILHVLNTHNENNKDKLIKLGIIGKGESLAVCAISMLHFQALAECLSDAQLAKKAARLHEQIEAALKDFLRVNILFSHHTFTVLVSDPRPEAVLSSDLFQSLEALTDRLAESSGLSFTAGIGQVTKNPQALAESARQAKLALNQQLYHGINKAYHYAIPERSSPAMINYLNKSVIDKLYRNIQAGNADELEAIIDSIVSSMAEREESGSIVKAVFRQMLFIGLSGIPEQVLEADKSFISYDIVHKLENCDTIFEMQKFVIKQCKMIISSSSHDKHVMSAEESIKSYIEYIEENYYRDIPLDEISSHFNLSPSYFSRHFKEMIGTTLINYINTYRVDIAKKLILDHKQNIYEIANSVGFNNYNSFSRAFKARVGVSPEHYKKAHHK